ncbi:ligase-associated DNA damage response endonuclease PdeM [Agrilutibacter solisilvae]|uniref:Ligase-associated DNA damage response endonuclease PdeM n=1 Tax=Agrilutibacter solisilvae TaxID=2763317 RepID=A0A974XZV7_9GAMM|nr:ligase-associated DNA damage response endonuclease PdeM [Lysobacter solisilvae]QSX78673.1 ligase-associated DNA damage response endonuclease PdeM [Lysobacter solisilvae]
MAERMDIVLGGEPMQLLGDRALYWPARRRVFVSDVHLGKADIFRRAGIALPSGGTRHDLERLAAIVADTQALSVCVLGDLLHGRADDRRWREGWEAFRAAHAATAFEVLAGNHDRALRTAGLDLTLLGDTAEEGPFSLRHQPDDAAPGYVLCGHVHPRVAAPGLPGRWPAFWLRARGCVLPAFSAFTGGREPELAGGDRLVACVQGLLLAL